MNKGGKGGEEKMDNCQKRNMKVIKENDQF